MKTPLHEHNRVVGSRWAPDHIQLFHERALNIIVVKTTIHEVEEASNIAQKDDFNSFIPATITMFSGANPARVARR